MCVYLFIDTRACSAPLVSMVCLCVCPSPRLSITSGMMWCDIDPYDWFNKFYGFYMAAVVGIGSGRMRDVSIYMRCGN